jgi:hypothetical protein
MPPRVPLLCRPAIFRLAKFGHNRSITFDSAGIAKSGTTVFKCFEANTLSNGSRSKHFNNRSVLVSNDSNPIGHAIAKRFLQEGAAKVVMLWKGRTIDKELRRQVDNLKQGLNYQEAPIIAMTKSNEALDNFQSWADAELANLVGLVINSKSVFHSVLWTR